MPSNQNDLLPGNAPHLTDAERAAREGFDDDGNELPAAPATADGAPAGETGTTDAGATAAPPAEDPGSPPAAAPTQDAAAAPPADTPPADTPSAAAPPQAGPVFAPQFDPGTPRDFAAELKALKEKYNAGELDDEAYESAREDIIEARTVYNTKAQVAEEISQAAWKANVSAFLQLPENATLLRSELMRDYWAVAMDRFANEAAAAGKVLTDWEILSGGRDKLFQEMGLSTATTPPAPTPTNPTAPAPAATKPPPVRAPDLSGVPPSIGAAPNAGNTGAKPTAEALAGKDIFEIEAFMAGQSEEAQEALLRSLPGAFTD